MSSSDAGWRTRVRWVVLGGAERPGVLALGGTGAPALPRTDLPGQVWSADAEVTVPALRELLGIDAVMLRCLGERDDGQARVRETAVLAAPRDAAPLPPRAGWAPPEELEEAAREGHEDAALASTALGELAAGRDVAGRAPWAAPGWLPEAERWLRDVVGGLGDEVTGPVRQVRVWELSCILRAPTTRGDVWFKATGAFPLFVEEGAVTRALAGLLPGHARAPLAVDAARGWMLLDDFGETLGWDAPVEVCEDVARTWARLQIQAAPLVDSLLAAGCMDRRLGWLAAEARDWLPALDETGRLPGIDAATWLSAVELAELRAAVPRLVEMCDELGGLAVPASLVHGDLDLSNVARGPGGYVFFDWTDACVAHPFVDLVTMSSDDDEGAEAVSDRLRDAYLAEWAAFGPAGRLLRAWRLAAPLGALNQAISYRSIVAGLTPPVEGHTAASTASWLRKVLAGLRDA